MGYGDVLRGADFRPKRRLTRLAATKHIENLPFTTKSVIGARARIGLVVLASDYTLENEFKQVITQSGVDLYHSRIANASDITPETLRAMGPTITETASRLLPNDDLEVLAYGCTSASTVLGPDTVNDMLLIAKPMAKVTNPVSAAFAAFAAFGAKRIAVLTPYRRDVNEFVQVCLERGGYEIPVFGSFNEEMDPVVCTIDEDSLRNGIRALLAEASVDAVFVSCTSIRMMHIVETLEAEFNLPITSSNHAMAWHCLRLAGVEETVQEYGSLFHKQINK